MSPVARTALVLLLGATLTAGSPASAAGAQDEPTRAAGHALLDVPYVSQTPALCGGAAVAMVLRYWGARDVFPEDFAPLVSSGDGGILTGTLVAAVRDRGWQAFVLPATDASARTTLGSEIDRGRPLIALIEVAPRTYHYIVVVGSTTQEAVVHDPREPLRVLPWADFDRAWAAAGRWMLLVLPATAAPSASPELDADPGAAPRPSSAAGHALTSPCGPMVDRGVQLAVTGDPAGADQHLLAATRLCPADPAAWRELAGLRFQQAHWAETRDLALTSLRLDPDDAYTWQLVATSRYLMGDTLGALDAWNRRDEPRIDTLTIHGAERTPHPVFVRAAGLHPRQVLTPGAFVRAQRRLGALPVAAHARMRYDPVDGGRAAVAIAIDEHDVVPRGWLVLAAAGARAVVLHEVQIDVAGPLGAGERATAAWRWSDERPKVAFGLAFPSPRSLPGILSFGTSWETQAYRRTAGSSDTNTVREDRRQLGLRVSDWSTGWLRWQAGIALDRMREYRDVDPERTDAREHLAVDGALDMRFARDRVAVVVSAGWWTPAAGGGAFGSGELRAAWRSSSDAAAPSWSAVSGLALASRAAPLALWHGAGTGEGRGLLLRAHPLLNDDILSGPAFGRELAHGSIEYARPVIRALAGAFAVTAYVDAARAWNRLSGLGTSPLYVDAGVGVRLRAPGLGGAFRVHVAHGLRGGGTTLSATWGGLWPR